MVRSLAVQLAMQRWHLAFGWVLALVVFVTPATIARSAELDNPEVAVEEARQSMGSPNWYDRIKDDFRPAKVEPPRASPVGRTASFGLFAELLRIVGWLALAIILAVIIFFIARASLDREASYASLPDEQTVVEKPTAMRVEELPVTLRTKPENYLDEARRHYREGEFGLAIVYLFSHQLLQLDRRHWIQLVKGKTNRQYLRELRRTNSSDTKTLGDVTERTMLLFEEFYFGKRLPPQGEIDAAFGMINHFESLVVKNEGHEL